MPEIKYPAIVDFIVKRASNGKTAESKTFVLEDEARSYLSKTQKAYPKDVVFLIKETLQIIESNIE
jgi:hypothetical protein